MRPSAITLWIVAAWTVLGILASIWTVLMPLFWIFAVLAVVTASVHFVRLRACPVPEVERVMLVSLPLGEWGRIALRVTSQSERGLSVTVFDHFPDEMQVEGQPFEIQLAPKDAVELRYRVRPTKRGDREFGRTQLRITWPHCLFHRYVFVGEPTVVRVYPNFKSVSQYALLAIEDQVRSMGIRRRRQRGTGLDFHQLREYRLGDSLRQIEWKATARHRKLISREYQEERDQRIIFVLDCGMRMHARDGDLSHFDHSLNALLLLSYVAIRQGDSVGLLTFSGEDRWLPPTKGAPGMTTILNKVYDLQTTLQPSDYLEAANKVMRHVPRRALVVMLTNLRQEDSAELRPALQMMRRRHLVLVASLRETAVEAAKLQRVHKLDDALQVAMAHQYLADRREAHAAASHFGVELLDVTPEDLPPALVDRYLDIKRSGAL